MYWDFAEGVYLSETQNPIPPPYTLYTCIPNTCSHREGGGELNQREGEMGNCTQSWVEKPSMTDCISSLYTLINTCPLKINCFR
jgi:hypothetical protein